MIEVFCHIVGLNNNIKSKIVKILKCKNFEVIDLDLINDKIANCNELNCMYRNYQNNSQKEKIKKIESEMINLWKEKFTKDVFDKVNKIRKKIILLGYNNHFKNENVNFKIKSKLKFFVKVDILKNAKKTIERNLDKSRNEIINGTFPLEYLQLDFLAKKRLNLIKKYKKLGYELKPIINILKVISNNINFNNIDIGDIYVASKEKLSNRIKFQKSRIIGYNIPWLSAISSVKSKNIKKGFKNNNGFVNETKKNGFKDLNQDCYIYKVDKENFYCHENGRNIKFATTDNVRINEKYYIENIYKYLLDNGIKLIK